MNADGNESKVYGQRLDKFAEVFGYFGDRISVKGDGLCGLYALQTSILCKPVDMNEKTDYVQKWLTFLTSDKCIGQNDTRRQQLVKDPKLAQISVDELALLTKQLIGYRLTIFEAFID